MPRRRESANPKAQPDETDSDPILSGERIDETLQQTFPASDPPSWTPLTGIGAQK
jgi:hypothetical protein